MLMTPTRRPDLSLQELVVDHIHTTLYEEDWQWQPSLSKAIEGLTAAQATWKPGPERHSIWQIVRHLILWKRAVLEAWNGNPPEGEELGAKDWQDVSGTDAAWQRDRQTLLDISEEFLVRARALDDAGLARRSSGTRPARRSRWRCVWCGRRLTTSTTAGRSATCGRCRASQADPRPAHDGRAGWPGLGRTSLRPLSGKRSNFR